MLDSTWLTSQKGLELEFEVQIMNEAKTRYQDQKSFVAELKKKDDAATKKDKNARYKKPTINASDLTEAVR